MAVPTASRFFNIKTFKYGADDYGTIKTVSFDQQVTFITDAGDADDHETFVEKGMKTTTFSITLSDPIQGQAILDHAKADITFTGQPKTGGVDVKVTITGAVVGGRSGSGAHNAVYTVTLSGRAENVTVALVS